MPDVVFSIPVNGTIRIEGLDPYKGFIIITTVVKP